MTAEYYGAYRLLISIMTLRRDHGTFCFSGTDCFGGPYIAHRASGICLHGQHEHLHRWITAFMILSSFSGVGCMGLHLSYFWSWQTWLKFDASARELGSDFLSLFLTCILWDEMTVDRLHYCTFANSEVMNRIWTNIVGVRSLSIVHWWINVGKEKNYRRGAMLLRPCILEPGIRLNKDPVPMHDSDRHTPVSPRIWWGLGKPRGICWQMRDEVYLAGLDWGGGQVVHHPPSKLVCSCLKKDKVFSSLCMSHDWPTPVQRPRFSSNCERYNEALHRNVGLLKQIPKLFSWSSISILSSVSSVKPSYLSFHP